MKHIELIDEQGRVAPYRLQGQTLAQVTLRAFNRIAYSAAHVVADARAQGDPWMSSAIDWDATLA